MCIIFCHLQLCTNHYFDPIIFLPRTDLIGVLRSFRWVYELIRLLFNCGILLGSLVSLGSLLKGSPKFSGGLLFDYN